MSSYNAFKWGTLTSTDSNWRQPFLQGGYYWDAAQNNVSWGNVSSGTNNIMQVYYLVNASEFGRTQGEITGSTITKAWMELNQYSVEDESWEFKVSVAGHEQGHGFGLGESSTSPALMNQNRNRESIYQPQTDDVNGINAIY